MLKKGQITLFLIIGIIIFAIVSLIIISNDKLTKSKISEEELKLKVTNYVEGCLKQTFEESIAITKGSPEQVSEIEDYIVIHLSDCTQFNETEFTNFKINKKLKDVKVSFNQDFSKISANINYPIEVNDKGKIIKFEIFSSEIPLKRSFCFDVKINNKQECIAQENKFVSAAGLSRDVIIGDSLLAGGVCLAC